MLSYRSRSPRDETRRVNQDWNLGLIRWRVDGTVNHPVSHTQHTRPRRCHGYTKEKGKKKDNFLRRSCSSGLLESVSGWAAWKWSFHPAMWYPLRTRALLHVCIYPVTQIRQDPIHLSKQLENMGFLQAHRASQSNSPWSELPNIPERLNIWYQIPLKAYNFQWLRTLEAYRWKNRPECRSLWSASLCCPTLLSYLLYTFIVERKNWDKESFCKHV